MDALLAASIEAKSHHDYRRALALTDSAISESERQGAFFLEALGYGARASVLLASGQTKASGDLERDLAQRLDQAVESGFTSAAVRLSLCLALVRGARSDQDGSSTADIQRSLKDAISRAPGAEYASARAGAYYALATLALASDDFLLAEHNLRKSVREADAARNNYIAGLARISLSNILVRRAPEEAASNLLTASAQFDSCGVLEKQLLVRDYVVQLYRILKDTAQALGAAARYRELAEASGRCGIMPDVWRTMAQVHMDAGSYVEANRYLKLELGLRRAGQDKEQLARCLEDLCLVSDKLGDSRQSINYGEEAVPVYASTGHVSKSVMVANFLWPTLVAEGDTSELRTTISYIEGHLDSLDDLDDFHRVLDDVALYYTACSSPRDYDRAAALLLKGLNMSDSLSERRVTYLTKLASASLLGLRHAERVIYLEEARRVARRIGSDQLGSIYADLSGAVGDAYGDALNQRVYAESAYAWSLDKGDTNDIKQALKALAYVGWPLPTTREYGYARELLELCKTPEDHNLAFEAYYCMSTFLDISRQYEAAFQVDSAWWAFAVGDQHRKTSLAGLRCLSSGRLSCRMTPELAGSILASVEKALAQSTDANELISLANYYRLDVADTTRALQWYERAIAVRSPGSLTDPFGGYGELLLAQGRTQEGIAALCLSIDVSKSAGELELAALLYDRVAHLYSQVRDYRSAVQFGEKELATYDELALRLGDSAVADSRAGTLSSLATYYTSLGETRKAGELAAQATACRPTASVYDASASMAYVVSLLRSGRIDSAAVAAERVFRSCRESLVRAFMAELMFEFAWGRRDTAGMNRWRQAFVATEIPDAVVKLEPTGLCLRAMQAYFRLDTSECAKYFNAALAAAHHRQPLDWDALASVHKFRAQCYLYAGDWQRALVASDSEFHYYDMNFVSLNDVDAIRGYAALINAQLPLLASLVGKVFEQNRDLSVIRRFVDITEKVSARSFLAAMGDRAGEDSAGTAAEALVLSARMAAITSELAGDLGDDTRRVLLQERDRVYAELTALDRHSDERNRGVYAPTAFVPVDVHTIMQDDLRDNQLAIRYYLFPQSFFAFAFTRDSFWVYPIPPEETLAVRIKTLRSYYRAFRPGTAGAEARMLRDQGYALYRQLLGYLGGRIAGKELVIIPDRVLYYLPFEMLVSDTLRTPDRPSGTQYLCESTRVTYAPSLSVYYHTTKEKPAEGSAVLALGKGSFNRQSARRNDSLVAARGITDLSYGIPDLQCAEGEAADVCKVLSGNARTQGAKSRTMIGPDASETNLKAEALDRYSYIHVATHGLIDDDNPVYSALLLDEVTSGATREDGVLYAFEIARLRLNANLVVLSACNTGLGRIWNGDGMIGLNWAFLAAGARALCVTLWSIDDKSTSVFMRHFYELLLKGASPAEALQETRVFMIRETEYRSPYYWAPFVLVGGS